MGEQTNAAESPSPGIAPAPDTRGDEELRIKEVFSAHLPTTIKKNSFRLWLHPHLGDFESKDFLRISLGVRYGITRRWEAGTGTDFYFSHGLGDVKFFDKYGIANIQFGTKYNLGQALLPGWDSAIGIEHVSPVDHPPADITDGLRHTTPYVSFSRRLESHPRLRVFWSVGADCVAHTKIPGELKKNDLGDSANLLSGGFVLDRGRLHYTFETIAATTRLLGHTQEDELTLKPGLIWELPTSRKGPNGHNWMIGASVKTVFGPDGTSYGASLKLRGNFDLKRWFGRH